MDPYVGVLYCIRLKDEKSPKPKKKFGSNFSSTLKKSAIGSIRRPNMANFKQRIKNKLRKGTQCSSTYIHKVM